MKSIKIKLFRRRLLAIFKTFFIVIEWGPAGTDRRMKPWSMLKVYRRTKEILRIGPVADAIIAQEKAGLEPIKSGEEKKEFKEWDEEGFKMRKEIGNNNPPTG